LTAATTVSTVGKRMPRSAAMRCTRRSTRSMFGAPLASARAADEGLARPLAAAAYFSNGTWSSGAAPSLRHSALTHSYTSRDCARSLCTASLIERTSPVCTQR
jgi:hypothetical protein